jgi:hypothetical protein
VRTAVAPIALSYVADLGFGVDPACAATLISRYTVAASIVVPTQARPLPQTR